MKKILWVSDNPLIPTGYSQVTRNVGSRLKRAGFDFNALGLQQFSMPIDVVKTQVGWLDFPIKPSLKAGEVYGNQGSIDFWTQTLKPNILIFLLDSFMIKHLVEPRIKDGMVIEKVIYKLKGVCPMWMYFPFDSQNVYETSDRVLAAMNERIAMSKFAQKLLKDQTGMDSHYIPHGVDTLIYRPLPRNIIEDVKKKHKMENKFIVGSVFRNQTRKLPTKLIRAFKIFSEGKDDVVLILHCDPQDPQGQNLSDFINRIKLDKNKVKFTGMNFISGVSSHEVNLLYNVMDVHALSTTGEGFGLPIIEAQAAGTPNVVTDYTTSRELVGDHGKLVKVKEFIEGQMNTDRAIIDVEHMATCFDKYYYNCKLLCSHAKRARDFTLKNYDWEKILRMWINLISFGDENAEGLEGRK